MKPTNCKEINNSRKRNKIIRQLDRPNNKDVALLLSEDDTLVCST